MQWEKDNSEKNELEDIIKKASSEIETLKQKLSQTEFDLKEARYEANQWSTKFQTLQEDKKTEEKMFQSKLNELQIKMDNMNKFHEDRYVIIALESDKVCKIMDSFLETSQIKQNDSLSKTMRHLLRKAISCMEKVKMTTTNSGISITELRSQTSLINQEVVGRSIQLGCIQV
jgi:DNA repair exonuclease SbcCD ATPase subunit